ncbi:hypothetical protein [Microcoleus sp. bin38.metabat.b11b12b14.051]|uniref:hypothetical protein n=1 Tax=Microcoleus sp. bin38.metabat.b11b12b14.051 TaxID=2742709 RepID=UPI0025CE8B40|nr:hypothetical protein [Microcoleus sp. bin38.metabat.b11b12b14.051]
MNNFLHSSETILDFLTLLEVEHKTSNLFNPAIWQDLNQLNLVLTNISKPDEIADAILDWCEKYPQIMDEFNETNWSQLRGDMFDEDEPEIQAAPPSNEADIIRNRDRIQKTIQDNQPNPDNTPENSPED